MNHDILGARKETAGDFLKVVSEYKAVYENFASFIEKVKAFPNFSKDDQAVFDAIREDYEVHYENLKVLEKELGEYSLLDEDEQDDLFEAGHEVVTDAAGFIFELPDRISDSDIGGDLEFEVPAVS